MAVGDLRNSTFIDKNRPVAIKEVTDKFGVRYVLEGSVRKSGIGFGSVLSSFMQRP